MDKLKEIIKSYLEEETDRMSREIMRIVEAYNCRNPYKTNSNELLQWENQRFCDKLYLYYKEHNLKYDLKYYQTGILKKESIIALLYLINKCKTFEQISEETGLKVSSLKVYRRFLKNAGYITLTRDYMQVNDGVLINKGDDEK